MLQFLHDSSTAAPEMLFEASCSVVAWASFGGPQLRSSVTVSAASLCTCFIAALAAEATCCAFFATRLLYAGQPAHPSAPPVPLQRPPPGQEPRGSAVFATSSAVVGSMVARRVAGLGASALSGSPGSFEGARDFFNPIGREVLRALR